MKQELLPVTASIARKLAPSSTPSATADSKLLPGREIRAVVQWPFVGTLTDLNCPRQSLLRSPSCNRLSVLLFTPHKTSTRLHFRTGRSSFDFVAIGTSSSLLSALISAFCWLANNRLFPSSLSTRLAPSPSATLEPVACREPLNLRRHGTWLG